MSKDRIKPSDKLPQDTGPQRVAKPAVAPVVDNEGSLGKAAEALANRRRDLERRIEGYKNGGMVKSTAKATPYKCGGMVKK